jgi:acetyl-CoA carboxylase, biotin carboxylase subunit
MVWKQWKQGRTRFRELRKRVVGKDLAAQTAGSPHGPWRIANSPPWPSLCRMLTLPSSDSRLWSSGRLNPPNSRMRTRMSGGVAGEAGRDPSAYADQAGMFAVLDFSCGCLRALNHSRKVICGMHSARPTGRIRGGPVLPTKLERPSSVQPRMFKKILIANRGEIAVRVIRACREMGIRTVAVYSDVDRAALHVRKSDEAYPIGPAPASDSYLRMDKILDVAKRSGAEAIHPGYGFLSENAKFAQACADAGVKFIGPTPHSMNLMGSKTSARQQMEKAGVPFVPGTSRGLASADEGEQVAERIGYPVMLKAAAGGGGKGMRLVHTRQELRSSLESAQSEAQRSFGDSEVYIEKAIVTPRHIEMQVLADEHGNTVWLGERECSIQRRHQKVLEEAPSPIVDPDMRRRMGDVAVKVAQAANYTNAGTVEFLVDQQKNFYFLEMNTRLQVEHPVTELTTGLDLVHLQIRIASGEKLPFTQSDVAIRGHAIECRIYAEDPDNNYFPSPGKITVLLQPSGPGIRRDSGMYEGWNVPMDYDPLLAKLIGYGTDRQQAIMRLERALYEYFVAGIKTNISLFERILCDADFQAGKLDTGYLDRLLAKGNQVVMSNAPAKERATLEMIAAIAVGMFAVLDPACSASKDKDGNAAGAAMAPSNWKQKGRAEGLR